MACNMRSIEKKRLVTAHVVCVVALYLFLLTPHNVVAQETPAVVKKAASRALAEGAFSEAIPLLEQLLDWFGDSDTSSVQAQMETVRFSLGMCHYIIGEFEPARNAYQDYLKHYRRGPNADKAAAYIGDTHRFQSKMKEAINAYTYALKNYQYDNDWHADIAASMAKCYLADENWRAAIPLLIDVYRVAPDWDRRNWAASLLAMSYLHDRQLEKVYDMMAVLLRPRSFASRSIALNLAALEVGDELFADEKYREALWIYRIVYPHDMLALNNMIYIDEQEKRVKRLRRHQGNIRKIVRAQENLGQVEQEIEALEKVKNYDNELFYRVARSCMEIKRYRESCELFYHLYKEGFKEKAEECLYLSFTSAGELVPFDRALETGLEYMKVYPGGEYYDTVSLMVAQFYSKLHDWPNTIKTLRTALEVSPEHEQMAECMFLLGYALFMEEQFEESADWLRRLIDGYPANERMADATYWLGMALLFDKKYEEAVLPFEDIVHVYPDCVYVEDASFRSATCDYGISMYESAEKKLNNFVALYPDGTLAGEAYVMLGDISGVYGDLHAAVRNYAKSAEYDINIELYNHSMFRAGEMLDEMADYEGLVKHFQDYLERARPGSNAPMAMYWIGNGYWKLGQHKKTLDFYMNAIVEFSDDRMATGVDLIIEEWLSKISGAENSLKVSGWRAVRRLIRKALDDEKMTMLLRVQRMLLYDSTASAEEKKRIHAFIMRDACIPDASVTILEMIADEALSKDDKELAQKAAHEIVDVFAETDTALYARTILARAAMESKDYDAAILQLNVIREVFASAPQAAEALLMLAEIYVERGQYDEADKSYKDVLGVKSWKENYPEALYGRGEVARERRQYAKAAAYYERIYVMYGFYRDWVAKAYLARAECLEKLREYSKAVEVLEEMLTNDDLKNGPLGSNAEKILKRVKERAQ